MAGSQPIDVLVALATLFQLAQLMIEYCLYSQEVIDEARLNLQSEYETQKAKADKLSKSDKEQKDQIALLKKELKLQRKTIAVYEDRLTKVRVITLIFPLPINVPH